MRTFCLLALVAFAACQSNTSQDGPFEKMLHACNEVSIAFYNNGDTVHFHTQDTTGVTILKQLISGRQEQLSNPCAAMGLLTYKANGQPVYTAEFAVTRDSKQASCNYVRYLLQPTVYMHRLSDRAHKMLAKMQAAVKSSGQTGAGG